MGTILENKQITSLMRTLEDMKLEADRLELTIKAIMGGWAITNREDSFGHCSRCGEACERMQDGRDVCAWCDGDRWGTR